MYEVIFYEDKNGKSEIEDYFYKITSSNQKNEKQISIKLRHQIELLKLLGPQMKMPQAKFLKEQTYPMWELRPMPERVFYISWQKNKFVLLSHYTKKQNKTDPKELKKANKLAKDWYERNGKYHENMGRF